MPFGLWGAMLVLTLTIGTPGGRNIFPCGRPSGRIATTNEEREDKEAKMSMCFQRPDVVAIVEGGTKADGVVEPRLLVRRKDLQVYFHIAEKLEKWWCAPYGQDC